MLSAKLFNDAVVAGYVDILASSMDIAVRAMSGAYPIACMLDNIYADVGNIATVLNNPNLGISQVASIFNQTPLRASRAADILANPNITVSRAVSILKDANLSADRGAGNTLRYG
jgi:hypothetical protein